MDPPVGHRIDAQVAWHSRAVAARSVDRARPWSSLALRLVDTRGLSSSKQSGGHGAGFAGCWQCVHRGRRSRTSGSERRRPTATAEADPPSWPTSSRRSRSPSSSSSCGSATWPTCGGGCGSPCSSASWSSMWQVDRLYRARPEPVHPGSAGDQPGGCGHVRHLPDGVGARCCGRRTSSSRSENMARAGSRVWRATVLCSLVGMADRPDLRESGLAAVAAEATRRRPR